MLTGNYKIWRVVAILFLSIIFTFSSALAQKGTKKMERISIEQETDTTEKMNLSTSHKILLTRMEKTANELIEKGFIEQPLSIYESAYKHYPQNRKVQNKLAWLYAWNTNYDKALDTFENILKKNPDNLDVQKSIAQVHGWAKEYDISINKYRSYLSQHPKDIEAIKGLAQIYAWSGQYDKSISLYQKALEIAPKDQELNKGLAQTLSWKGEVSESIEHYGRTLALYPQYVSAHRELAVVYAQNRKFDKAFQYYKKAIEIDPKDPDSYVGLATTARWDRRFGLAEEKYYRALDLRPNYKPAMDGLRALELARSLEVNVGVEQDYLSNLYYTSLAYPVLRKQDLQISYSYLDRTYYFRNRAKVELQHYFSLKTRLKFAFSNINYNYPEEVNPDNTSRTKSNDLSLQLNTFLSRSWQVQVGYQFSQTHLFHWPDVNGKAHFIQLGLQKNWTPWLTTEAGLAILHDFDPGVSDSLVYNNFTLFQGALFFNPLNWLNIDLRYIPNRDLDNSISQTYLAHTRLELSPKLALQFRYRHDEYRKGVLIDEYLGGLELDLFKRFKLMLAYKRIDGPVKQGNYVFINLLTRIYEDL